MRLSKLGYGHDFRDLRIVIGKRIAKIRGEKNLLNVCFEKKNHIFQTFFFRSFYTFIKKHICRSESGTVNKTTTEDLFQVPRRKDPNELQHLRRD